MQYIALPHGHLLVILGYPWLSLAIRCFSAIPWLSLATLGYFWLSLASLRRRVRGHASVGYLRTQMLSAKPLSNATSQDSVIPAHRILQYISRSFPTHRASDSDLQTVR